MRGGERRHLGVEAVGAEDLRGVSCADRLGLGGGGGEDEDAAAGEAVHLGVDRDVAVFQPPADDGELLPGGGVVGHARCRQPFGTMRTPRSSLRMR